MRGQRPDGLRQIGQGIARERIGIDTHDRHVAEDQQDVDRCGRESLPEGLGDEFDRTAGARIAQREADIGIGGDEGDGPADQKGNRGSTLGACHGDAEGGKEAAADDPSHTDRQRPEDADAGLLVVNCHVSTRDEGASRRKEYFWPMVFLSAELNATAIPRCRTFRAPRLSGISCPVHSCGTQNGQDQWRCRWAWAMGRPSLPTCQ